MANKFQVFGKDGNNIISPYASDNEVLNGFQPGTIINSATMNSVLKQNSLITYAIAQYIVTNNLGGASDIDIEMTPAQIQTKVNALFNALYEWKLYLTSTDNTHTDKFLIGHWNSSAWVIQAKHLEEIVWPSATSVNLLATIVSESISTGTQVQIQAGSGNAATFTITKCKEAESASTATNATNAIHATNADNATNATNADNATNATNANYATSAGSATTAASATNATNLHSVNNNYTADSLDLLLTTMNSSITAKQLYLHCIHFAASGINSGGIDQRDCTINVTLNIYNTSPNAYSSNSEFYNAFVNTNLKTMSNGYFDKNSFGGFITELICGYNSTVDDDILNFKGFTVEDNSWSPREVYIYGSTQILNFSDVVTRIL